MAKKKSWFNLLKRIFISDPSKPEKEKKRRWVFQGSKIKRLASLAPPSASKEKTLGEAEEEQSKHAVTVAIATAAAAEAAVAAAQVAAEVVRLTNTPTHSFEEETGEFSAIKIQSASPQSTDQCEREIQELAAVKIQTAFRGYLARKALRALKGLVKLQAIIRGRAVRRQAITTLKCLQSIVSIQSQVCARRFQIGKEIGQCDENKQLQELREKVIKIESNGLRRWDGSILSKEEANALFLSKKEAAMKRERIKEYSLTHRKPTEPEQNKANGKWRYWLEQWVDTRMAKRGELEELDLDLSSNPRPREEYGGKQLKLKNFQRQYNIEGLVSPISVPRRSFHHRRQRSIGDDSSLVGSPIVPTYMAATQSAKAKVRSMSSPKLRPGSLDTYSDSNSPCKNKLSSVSSIAGEVRSSGRIGKPDGYQQGSPSLKSLPGPIKSSRTLKDLSFDSEWSTLNWDRHSTFR
ncbi:hypothetical protein L1049_012103 [Liquidambar formosana]|uniref:DUF4005 domain-containing protein n=1 Tax=Liquidambar formosana TaxID=63359 RepID=A0AAP0RYE4_LIQFO